MTRGARILIVEDAENEREALVHLLRTAEYSVIATGSAREASRHVDVPVDVVVSDLHSGKTASLELQRYWKSRQPGTRFIVVTADDDDSSALEAMKLGSEGYLSKPVNADEVLTRIGRCLEEKRRDDMIVDLRHRLDERLGFEGIVGQSQAMLRLFEHAHRATAVDSTVLVTGEAGTGKETIAEAIHQNSRRQDGPFVTANIAAIPAQTVDSELFGHIKGALPGATVVHTGRFEDADRGTLFIHEIGHFSLRSQVSSLRLLERHRLTPIGGNTDREVNVRVIAATSCNLDRLVSEGRFREDLYYGLNVVHLYLPPLRERREDIPLLVNHFIVRLCEATNKSVLNVDSQLRRFLETYSWPGNVQQLRACLEDMIVCASGDTLTLEDLPATIDREVATSRHATAVSNAKLKEVRREAVMHALQLYGGNRTRAANALGISVRTLQRKHRSRSFKQASG